MLGVRIFLEILMLACAVKTQGTKFSTGVIVGHEMVEVRDTFKEISDYYAKANLRATLDPIIELVDMDNVLLYSTPMCSMMDHGVFAIFGTLSLTSEPLVDQYTRMLQMPFVTISESFSTEKHKNKIRLLPDIAPALKTAVTKMLKWKKSYYFYSSKEALYRYSRFTAQLQKTRHHMDMRLVHLNSDEEALGKIDTLLKKLNYVLDEVTEIKVFLDMGAQTNCGILYKIETASLINWQKFTGGGMNLTVFQLVDTNNRTARLSLEDIKAISSKNINGGIPTLGMALTMDAFGVMRRGFIELQNDNPLIHQQVVYNNNFYNNGTRGIQCDVKPAIPWRYGITIANYFKKVNFDGLSGPIAFDENGFRKDFVLDILNMEKKTEPMKIGYWHNEKISILPQPLKILTTERSGGLNRTRIITTHLGEPYVFYKEGAKDNPNIPSNEKFDGYIVDIAKAVMGTLELPYLLVPVKDGQYGNELANKSWNGMVGEIIRGEADLAIADLTITSLREEVIYFSKPFLRLGISIMIKKPEEQEANKYSFVEPLAYEVWMCVGFAYIGVSVVLFLVGRFSPYEWHIDANGVEPAMKNEFSVWNSLWFTFSTLMQQGCEVAPRAISSRIVASVWYLFTLIMISSYTANLAAFLTAARMNSPINSVDDLAKQTAIKYGTLRGGSTMSFFQDIASGVVLPPTSHKGVGNSKYPTYKKMWSYMERNPEGFTDSNDAGLAKVIESNGRYAYLVESTFNEYKSNREPCNTMRVGANLNSQGYGIGMPLDSDLKSKINIAILQLREKGVLADLEKKWWREFGNICPQETKDASSTSRLTVNRIEGIFHILAAGVFAGILVAGCELLFISKMDSVKSGGTVTFKESLKAQLALCRNGMGSSVQAEEEGKLPNQTVNTDYKFSEGSEPEGGASSKDKTKFLSVDDVFSPVPTAVSNKLPVVRQRSALNAVSSTPKEVRSNIISTISDGSDTVLSNGGGDKIGKLKTPVPPEEFRSHSGSHHTSV